ncbi:MAG: LPS export ABC transporter permease LptF [Xanthomonadales bacterium]|jgi:lipopolysaccharide export system permease protein|nr:LPS export ABC transporter permease LptF [Xanthomonadales bacterium]MDH3940924.1 LPS export ABC transporter permease LptF [Xanthomonadales bacterium]MDH4002439.1 LPS export ABC transporter permease LptF [Xanthomonadales bacterium]
MIIDHYLRREISVPFAAVSGVLVSIFVTYALTRFLMDVNAALLAPSDLFKLTMLKALISLEVLLPLSLYLAVLMGLGRLHSDSEVYAMRASGISEMRVLRPIIAVAFLLAMLIGLFSLFVRPWAYAVSYEIKARVEAATEVDRVRGARFYNFEESGRTIFVKAVSGKGRQLEEVFIRSGNGGDVQVITAVSGELRYLERPEHHQLVLNDASVFRRTEDGPDLFAELGSFSLWMPAGQPDPVGYKTKSSSTFELLESDNNDDKAELQWRISTPLSALLLALLAIPLSRSRPRQGRYARILGAMIIYAVYFNLLDVSRTWVEQGTASTIWWAPGALAALVALLYFPWRKLLLARQRSLEQVA